MRKVLKKTPCIVMKLRRNLYEGRLLCSETGMPARAEVLRVKSLREESCQSQNIITGPRNAMNNLNSFDLMIN